ncbi:MAG: response regulator transcription factor [Verrucomicrobiota bacterium]
MKLLIAEDDRYTREGLTQLLEKEGFTVAAAANGREAIDLFNREKPDLVCLDVMMPELDGYEVCKRIRRTDPAIPLLFLSAKAEEIDTVLGLELGADDYIAKPFGVREILARIRAILRRTQLLTQKDATLEDFDLGPLQVLPSELRALRNGQEIQLSLRDLKILQLLHRHRGKVITRDQLYEHAWGLDYYPHSRSLDQHISQLRKKIESDPTDPQLIQTVHGAGYRYP